MNEKSLAKPTLGPGFDPRSLAADLQKQLQNAYKSAVRYTQTNQLTGKPKQISLSGKNKKIICKVNLNKSAVRYKQTNLLSGKPKQICCQVYTKKSSVR